MNLRGLTIFAATLVLLLSTPGCDRDASSPGPTGASTPGTEHYSVDINLITPLLPRLRTHVAIDSRGNLYWVQETDPPTEHGDLLYTMGTSGVPQTIPELSGRRLLGSIGLPETLGVKATIRSMVVGSNDDLFLLVSGGSTHVPLYTLISYSAASKKIKIVASTEEIMKASGLGASLDLARGTLLSYEGDLWLWLRHTDASALLRLTFPSAGAAVDMRLLTLKPPSRLAKLTLHDEQEDLAAGPHQTLLYIDRPRAILWRINDSGEYAPVQSLEGFSVAMTPPIGDSAGRLRMIAGDGDPLIAQAPLPDKMMPVNGRPPPEWNQLSYPALIQTQPNEVGAQTVITLRRDDFVAPPTLPLQDLQPRQLLLDRTNGTLVTFDSASGELLRLKIRSR